MCKCNLYNPYCRIVDLAERVTILYELEIYYFFVFHLSHAVQCVNVIFIIHTQLLVSRIVDLAERVYS